MDRTIHKNGLIRKELFLLVPFVKEPWREFTITEVKSISKNRSHHYVFEAMKKFSKKGVLMEKRKGNTNTYAINPASHDLHYLTLVENTMKEQRKDVPYTNIKQVTDKIKSPYYTFIIGGSYAVGKQKPRSDLDVGIVIPDAEDKKPFEIALKDGRLMIPEIHGFVFTSDEFFQMLVNNEFNFGKELARKHIIYYGAEQYYKILFEAMKHGFKG